MKAVTRKQITPRPGKRKLQRRTGPRTAWHLLLFLLLQERAPRAFQVRAEVTLGKELPRADLVLLRRKRPARVDDAQVLRGLWSRIARDAVVEFKSVPRPFRRGDLGKLLGYAGFYYWMEAERLGSRRNLLTVLLVPLLTQPLADELVDLELIEQQEESGYREYAGGTFPLLVIELDRVAEAERDELLGHLGHGTLSSVEAHRWWNRVVGPKMAEAKQLEEYEDFEAKFIASLPPERRLLGLDPEQRLAGLDPEQMLAGLSKKQKAELRRLLEQQN